MRMEHDWDREVGVCMACGVKREGSTLPAATPRPPERPIVARPATAAEGLRKSPGGIHRPTPDARRAFGQMAGGGDLQRKATAPAPVIPPFPGSGGSAALIAEAEDSTHPVNWDAVIAELKLEREELDFAISTLERHRAAKASRA